jgi:hypothetical protein
MEWLKLELQAIHASAARYLDGGSHIKTSEGPNGPNNSKGD